MKDVFDISGRVAVVTGASSGLGVEFAKALAFRGADLALLARRADKLEQVAADIRAMGRKALPVPCDVSDETAIENAVAAVMAEFGRIDILVNNAGTCFPQATVDVTQEDWRKIMSVNLDGVFFVTKHVVPHMMERKYGRIVNIASMYGLRANPMGGAIPQYYASKGAIPQLTRGWAQEFALHGITVNAIAPGFFPSEIMQVDESEGFLTMVRQLIPLGRPGKVEELDGLIALLASDGASYITGQTIPIDGGKTAI